MHSSGGQVGRDSQRSSLPELSSELTWRWFLALKLLSQHQALIHLFKKALEPFVPGALAVMAAPVQRGTSQKGFWEAGQGLQLRSELPLELERPTGMSLF